MKYWAMGLGVVLAACMAGCGEKNLAQARAARAAKPGDEVVIGAAGPWASADHMLWKGLELARDEINARGGVLGRRIELLKADDESSVSQGQIVAQQFAENPDVVAVVGHVDSHVSVPTALVYDYNGLLMITPYATNPKLTQQGLRRVFRAIPDDEVAGTELAGFCRKQGYRRVVVFHINNENGTGLANAFEKQCERENLTVVDRVSYDSFSGVREFDKALSMVKDNFQFDALVIAGILPQAAVLIREARKLGIAVPIVGSDGLDTDSLLTVAGEAAENTFVASTFHPADPRPEAQVFVKAFEARYGKIPDTGAAQGYDCLRVLVHAMEQAGTTAPDAVAEALKGTTNWPGVTGSFGFGPDGNRTGTGMTMKVVRGGKFELFAH